MLGSRYTSLPLPILAIALCAPPLCPAADPEPAADQEIVWREDIEQTLREANSAGKPVLIQFTASWCGYCHKMFRGTFKESSVASLVTSHMMALKVDADKHKELAEKVGVEALPTTIIVGPDLKILKKLKGYQTADKLVAHLEPVCGVNASTIAAIPVSRARNNAAPAPAANPDTPAFGGCCLVSLREKRALVKGLPQHSLTHRGRRIVFASDEDRARFLENPAGYWPMLDGQSAVALVEEERRVEGLPRFGAIYRNRMWFFETKQQMLEFVDEPSDYASAVR